MIHIHPAHAYRPAPSLLVCVVLALIALAPAAAKAETCAWLNAATAGGLLGAESTVKIAHATGTDATCTFTPLQAPAGTAFEITVHTLSDIHADYQHFAAACTPDTPETISLRAVGNQAVECTGRTDPHLRKEKVIGRVRDRAFILTWTISAPETGPNSIPQDLVREKLRNVAEQVAGSLF